MTLINLFIRNLHVLLMSACLVPFWTFFSFLNALPTFKRFLRLNNLLNLWTFQHYLKSIDRLCVNASNAIAIKWVTWWSEFNGKVIIRRWKKLNLRFDRKQIAKIAKYTIYCIISVQLWNSTENGCQKRQINQNGFEKKVFNYSMYLSSVHIHGESLSKCTHGS